MARARRGETVRGYKLLNDFKMAGGGNCEWTFAQKDGKEYFIKVFLNPKYPKLDGPGSAETKEKLRKECEEFEKHQRDLNKRVKDIAGPGGRLVAATDFFREDNLFYKVALKVPAAPVVPKDIAKLDLTEKIRLLQNVSSALQGMHTQRIIHGDLKIDNVLLEKGPTGSFTARVIDFDSSYIAGAPPDIDNMMGDPPYYSPELLNYVQGKDTDPMKLSVASDVFALALVFHQYLTGEFPELPSEHKYACEAVRAGHVFSQDSLRDVGSTGLAGLLSNMLSHNPTDRPFGLSIANALREIAADPGRVIEVGPAGKKPDAPRPGPKPDPVKETKPTTKPGGLRGTGLKTTGGVKTSTEGPSPETESKPVISEPTPKVRTPGSDLTLPGTYRVEVGNLIKQLERVDKEIAKRKAIPVEPTRIKGSLAKSPRDLSVDESASLAELGVRLNELVKHADDLAQWISGDLAARPAPAKVPSDDSPVDIDDIAETAPESAEPTPIEADEPERILFDKGDIGHPLG
jgi:serine/threonine protein kinase